MVGTRSTRSRPQSSTTAENTQAELAAPKRNQRRKRLAKAVEASEVIAAENGEMSEQIVEMDGAGDKMELDNERIDNAKTEEIAKASDEIDKVMEEAPNAADDDHMNGPVVVKMAEADKAMEEPEKSVDETNTETQITTSSFSTPQKGKSFVGSPQATLKNKNSDTEIGESGAALAPKGDTDLEIRRSGRKRLAPTVLDEVVGKTAKTKAGARANAWKAASQSNDVDDVDSEWEEEYLMTNPGSVYARSLGDFFSPDVWNQFSESEKIHLISFLPECDKVYPPSTDPSDPTTPKAGLVEDFWDNPQLLTRISHVEADIADGKYTPETQAAIVAARKRSEAGEFNQFKDNKFEQFWGQKQRVNYEAVAGDTSGVKIQTLAKHHALRVGDVFSLRRSFGRGGVTVEKDAKLTAIDPDDFSLTFSYPPGKLQVSSDQKPDKVISNVVSVTALENLLCKEDGRAPSKLPNGNAFKTFRIRRNEQDIGSLFDVRTEFHAKYLSPKTD